MKTKHLFGLVTVVAVTGFAASAQAGWSVNFSFGMPVLFPPPVVVVAPRCLPPVICPPRVTYCPPPAVYTPPVCRAVVYAAPRCGPNYGYPTYLGQGYYRDRGAWAHYDRGHNHGGHR